MNDAGMWSSVVLILTMFAMTAHFLLKSIWPHYTDGPLGNWIIAGVVIACIYPTALCTRALGSRVARRRMSEYEKDAHEALDKRDPWKFEHAMQDIKKLAEKHFGPGVNEAVFSILVLTAVDPRFSPEEWTKKSIVATKPERLRKYMKELSDEIRGTGK